MKPVSVNRILPHILAVVIFFAVALLFGLPALRGKVIAPANDLFSWQCMSHQSFEYKDHNGHFPLWSTNAFSGMPACTIAMQPSTGISLDPILSCLTLGMPEPISFFFVACLCFYILALSLGISPWIATISSLAYAYASYDPVIIVTGHLTKMWAIAYAPGVFAGAVLLTRKKYLSGLALMALFWGLQLNTQHVQIVYYTLLGIGFLNISLLLFSWKQKQLRETLPSVSLMVLAGVLGLGASMASSLYLQDYAKETMRGGRTELSVDAGAVKPQTKGLDRNYAFYWSYGIPETLTLVVPDIYGGGSGGDEMQGRSLFADSLEHAFSYNRSASLEYANSYAYWGPQPFTSGTVYLGAIMIFLAIFGLLSLRGWQCWWLAALGLTGILLAWGNHFPAFNYFLFDHLPFYNKFRAPAMSLVMPQLAVPLLAALGLEQVRKQGPASAGLHKAFRRTLFITALLFGGLMLFYCIASFQGPSDIGDIRDTFARIKMSALSQEQQSATTGTNLSVSNAALEIQAQASGNNMLKAIKTDRRRIFGRDLLRSLAFTCCAALLLGLFLSGRTGLPVLLAGLLLLSTMDLLGIARRYLNYGTFVEPQNTTAAFKPNAADLQILADHHRPFRVFDETSDNPFQDARASYFHQSIGGYSPAKLGLYQDLIDHQLSKKNPQVLNMLNTKYFITLDPSTRQATASLNPDAYGPCWLVRNIHYVSNGNEEMHALDSIGLKDTVVIQQQYLSVAGPGPVPDSNASISLTSYGNDTIRYRSSATTAQFAVFSEIYYDRGWIALMDGRPAPYCRVNYLLRGMPLPAGDHAIEFIFAPRSYRTGNAIQLISCLLVFLLLLIAFGYAPLRQSLR